MKFYYNLCSVETTDIKSGGSGEHYKAGKSTLALKPKTTSYLNRDRRVSVQGCVTLADERQNLETLIHTKMIPTKIDHKAYYDFKNAAADLRMSKLTKQDLIKLKQSIDKIILG